MKKGYFILLGILTLGTRLVFLHRVPYGFYCDEAFNGYDAYSLLRTGKDIYGETLPLFLDHYHEDRVEPLFTYGLIPFVALVGLQPWVIRLFPSLVGMLTILFFFLWLQKRYGENIAFMGSFFLALSPWHVALSRVGFRAILGPFLITLFLYLWEKKVQPMVLALTLGLSAYTYGPVRVFLPLFLLWFIAKEKPWKVYPWKKIFQGGTVFFLLLLPIFWASLQPTYRSRFDELSIFSQEKPFQAWMVNVEKHLSPKFLWFSGDPNLRHGYPKRGILNPLVSLFALLGLFLHREGKSWFFLFFAGFLPSTLFATGSPNALRSVFVLPFPMVLASLGFSKLLEKKKLVSVVLAVISLAWGAYLWGDYMFHQPQRLDGQDAEGNYIPNFWQAGFSKALKRAETLAKGEKPILVSLSTDQAPILVLFFKTYPPEKFHQHPSLPGYLFFLPQDMEKAYQAKVKGVYVVLPIELTRAKGELLYLPNGKPGYKILVVN